MGLPGLPQHETGTLLLPTPYIVIAIIDDYLLFNASSGDEIFSDGFEPGNLDGW